MSNEVFGAFKELLREAGKVLEQNTSLDFGLSNKSDGESVVSQQPQVSKKVEISDVVLADEYTERRTIFGKVKFKHAKPTCIWDSNDNFGSDLDTTMFYSENGVEVDPEIYHNTKSHIEFIFDVDDKSDSSLREQYNRYYGITTLNIESVDRGVFKKHVNAEDSKMYFESYVMFYETKREDGSPLELTYSVQLILYKNECSQEQLNRMASEYQGIIDSFEVVSFVTD